MKNWKKYAAILGVIALLAVFCLPMVFALRGDFSLRMFMASLFAVMFVAVMGYVIWMLFRHLNKKNKGQETSGMIKNVIFDVGKVLVEYNWEEYLAGFGFSEEKYNKIADATFRSTIWVQRDKGDFDNEYYVNQMVGIAPEYEADIREVMRRSPETIHRMPYAETWIKYLKSRGYHVYILSNYSRYMLDHTKKELSFRSYMDGCIFSCDVKEIKPDPQIYRILLNEYGLTAGECVFIDDVPENGQAAEALGIHAICFKSFKQAAAELEKLGVK